jgi:hypothetical protein
MVEIIFAVVGILILVFSIGWALDQRHPETYDEGYMGEPEDKIDEIDEEGKAEWDKRKKEQINEVS